MKDKGTKQKNVLYNDESYLQGFNLITGAKIDNQRQLMSDLEIQRLCLDQKLSKTEKFIHIITQNNNMQQWSAFENLPRYITSSEQSTIVFETISKRYSEFPLELLMVLGEGVENFLRDSPEKISEKSKPYIYNILYRTMTTFLSSQLAFQWAKAFELYFQMTKGNIDECLTFISGSFSMNASPLRRQVAFIMIDCLFEHSSIPWNQMKTKVIFFSRDHNFKTRQIICEIVGKMIKRQKDEEQLWKIIGQYFQDSEASVMTKALKIICFHKKQIYLENILSFLQNQQKITTILPHLQLILSSFSQQITIHPHYKQNLLKFINNIFKGQNNDRIQILISQFNTIIKIINQSELFQHIELQNFNTIKKSNITYLLELLNLAELAPIREKIKNSIHKGLKYHGYNYFDKPQLMIQCYDYNVEEDVNIYLNLITKLLDNSKWKNLQIMIPSITLVKMNQNLYEKISLFLLRIIMNSPYFLIDLIIKQIIYMMLANRRCLDFLITIRQKLMNSKCWIHRRNYLILYFAIKSQSSFQFQKMVPVYIYKNVSLQKCSSFKLQFIRTTKNAYFFIDPASNERILMRHSLIKLTEDKDVQVAKRAIEAQKQLDEFHNKVENAQLIYNRNNNHLQIEQKIKQIEGDSKKFIKTEKDLRMMSLKKKTEIKTYQNLSKQSRNQMSQERIKLDSKIQAKKTTIFRCSSQRVRIPPLSNKGKI